MNLVKYFECAINEYDSILKILKYSDSETDIEKGINDLIDYIFKYNNTQQFESFDNVSIVLTDIVDFCKSDNYSYEGLIKYKEELISKLELFRDILVKYNTIRVIFQNTNVENKYRNYIYDKYINDYGLATVLLHDSSWSVGAGNYFAECNIEQYFNEAVQSSISPSMLRESLHLKANIDKIRNSEYKIKNLITGSSYSLYGIDNKLLEKDTLNVSMLAQDIYYNFQIVKEAVKNNKEMENCIVTIAHYNFHYDMSLVNTPFYRELLSRVYYANLYDKHNCIEDLSKFKFKGNIHAIPLEIRDIFKSDFADLILNKAFDLKSVYDEYFDEDYTRAKRVIDVMNNVKKELSEDEVETEGNRVVSRHNNLLKYKKTEVENKSILKELLLFLNKHNVKATLVVFPMSVKYRELINPEYKNIFDTYIKELKDDCDFNLIDLYDDNRFTGDDFEDIHHLSLAGAQKATKIIKEKVGI